MVTAEKKEMIQKLQQQILALQGGRSALDNHPPPLTLGGLERAFPNNVFPLGAVHEFISYNRQEASATKGFITALLSQLNGCHGYSLWVGRNSLVFPPALKVFGFDPDHIFFVQPALPHLALWIVEETLKCEYLSAVIADIADLSFTDSRRLQLAVEKSRVTGFIHRFQPRNENTTACVSRWKIRPMSSEVGENLPGVGFPRWNVQLLKVRNGKTGNWQMEWTQRGLRQIETRQATTAILSRKTG